MRSTLSMLALSLAATCLAVLSASGSHAANFNSPGGLEKTNLTLWLDANLGVETLSGLDASFGQSVEAWRDQSGKGNDAIQNTATSRPTYLTGGPNASAVLYFPSAPSTAPRRHLAVGNNLGADSFTVFTVARTLSTHQLDSQSASGTGGTAGQQYLLGPQHGGTNAGSGISLGTNGISVYEHGSGYMPALAVYSATIGADFNSVGMGYVNKQPSVFFNGEHVHTGVTSNRATVFAPREIGGQTSYGELNGEIAEVIMFDRVLNLAERIIVENYISAKYNTPINSALDIYSGDDPVNGDYDYNMIGVGQASNGSNALSARSAGFGLEVTGGLANDQWITAGHKLVANAIVQTNELPGMNLWQRSWFVDVTGTGMSANVQFDLVGAGPDGAFGNRFSLLYRENELDDWEALVLGYDNLNGIISFALPPEFLQSGYYTIGALVVPEPSSFVLLACGACALIYGAR